MGLTTVWPLKEKPEIGHLKESVEGDFSETFGRLHFKLELSAKKRSRKNFSVCHSKHAPLVQRAHLLLLVSLLPGRGGPQAPGRTCPPVASRRCFFRGRVEADQADLGRVGHLAEPRRQLHHLGQVHLRVGNLLVPRSRVTFCSKIDFVVENFH